MSALQWSLIVLGIGRFLVNPVWAAPTCDADVMSAFSCKNLNASNPTSTSAVQLSWCESYNPLSMALPLSSVGQAATHARTILGLDNCEGEGAESTCTFITDVTFATSASKNARSVQLLVSHDGANSAISILDSAFQEASTPVPLWRGKLSTVTCVPSLQAAPFDGALCLYGGTTGSPGRSAYSFSFVNTSTAASADSTWSTVDPPATSPSPSPSRAFVSGTLFTLRTLDAPTLGVISPFFSSPPPAYVFALILSSDNVMGWSMDALLWLPSWSPNCTARSPSSSSSCFVRVATWNINMGGRAGDTPSDILLRTVPYAYRCGASWSASSFVNASYYAACPGQARLMLIGSKRAATVSLFAFSLEAVSAAASSTLDLYGVNNTLLDVNALLGDGSRAQLTDVIGWSEVALAAAPTGAAEARPSSVWVAATINGARDPTKSVVVVRLPQFSDPLDLGGALPPVNFPTTANPSGYSGFVVCGNNSYYNAVNASCAPLPSQWILSPLAGNPVEGAAAGLAVAWRGYSEPIVKAVTVSSCPPYNITCLASRLAASDQLELSQKAMVLNGGRFVLAVRRSTTQVHMIYLAPIGCLSVGQGELGTSLDFARVVELGGVPASVTLPPNAMSLWAPIARKRSYVVSKARLVDVCKALLASPDDPYLLPFEEDCAASPGAAVASDFVQVISVCPRGSYCPSFTAEEFSTGKDGTYSEMGLDTQVCTRGSYCAAGVRITCPSGFMCPNPGMALPMRCTPDLSGMSSCFEPGTVTPRPCAASKICLTFAESVFVPPNYTNVITRLGHGMVRTSLQPCPSGSYCNLGRTSAAATTEALACPAGSTCATPDVMVPSACNLTGGYCPAGSVALGYCPAGSFCPVTLAAFNCSAGAYCPVGSTTFIVCPAGYYCPTPDQKLLCPQGAFCPEGSAAPTLCGTISAWACTEGGSKPPRAFELAVGSVVVGLIALVVIGYYQRARLLKAAKTCCPAVGAAAVAGCCGKPRVAPADAPLRTLTIRRTGKPGVDGAGVAGLVRSASVPSSSLSAVAVLGRKSTAVEVRCVDLGLKLASGDQKVVLSGVNATLRPGRVCAVMGASGSGKTTFLTTLCGKAYYGKVSGDVFVNGARGSLSEARYRHLVGFVPQEDIMIRDLTVTENIAFSALTRLPRTMPTKDKLALADKIVALLGLSHVKDVRIGDESERGVSGGQRKRVNVGIHLAADPSILLLDEPTSGLDAQSALLVCTALQSIAALNITVVLVLHQPRYEIFAQFDDVLLLGAGGRTVYFGPVSDALPYFARRFGAEPQPNTNPADFLLDLSSGVAPSEEWAAEHPRFSVQDLFDAWEQEEQEQQDRAKLAKPTDALAPRSPSLFEKGGPQPLLVREKQPPQLEGEPASLSPRAAETDDPAPVAVQLPSPPSALPVPLEPAPFQGVGFFRLTALIAWRSFLQQWRRPKIIMTNLALPAFAAALLAGISIGVPGFIVTVEGITDRLVLRCSMAVLGLSLVAVTGTVAVFRDERAVYFREASELAQPMHSIAYFLGKDLSIVPTMFAASAVFTFIYHAIAMPRGGYFEYFVPFLGSYFVCCGYGYLIAVVFPRSNAVVLGASIVFSSVLLGGSIITLNEFKSRFVPLNLAPYISYVRYALEALYVQEVEKYIPIGDIIDHDLSEYVTWAFGFYFWTWGQNVGYLFAFGLCIHVAALVCMVLLDRDRKR